MATDYNLQSYKNEVIIFYALKYHFFDKVLKNKNIFNNKENYDEKQKAFLETKVYNYIQNITHEKNLTTPSLLSALAINDFCDKNKDEYSALCNQFDHLGFNLKALESRTGVKNMKSEEEGRERGGGERGGRREEGGGIA